MNPTARFLGRFLPLALVIIAGTLWLDPSLAAPTNPDRLARWLLAAALLLVSGLGLRSFHNKRQAAQDNRAQLKAIVDYAMVGIATLAPDYTFASANPALCRMLGYRPEDLLHKRWTELIHPEERIEDSTRFAAIQCGESDGYSQEKRFLGKEGNLVHATIAVRAIRNPRGELDCLVAIIEDISTWVIAESEWLSSVKTLQRFIDHLPGTAYVQSADSRVLVANKGVQEQFGVHPQEIIGRLASAAFTGPLGQKLIADDQRILAQGTTERIDLTANGRTFESTKFVIPRDDGSADLGCITIDVTQRRLNEHRLTQQAHRSALLLELPKKAAELSEAEFMEYALTCAQALTHSPVGYMHYVNDDDSTIECNKGLRPGQAMPDRQLSQPLEEDGMLRMLTGVADKREDYTEFDRETMQLIASETWRIMRQQRAEQALRLAMQVVNASPVVCFRWSAKDSRPIVFVSDNVAQWGYQARDLVAGKPSFAELMHPDDRTRINDEIARYNAQGATAYRLEYRLLTAAGEVIWVYDRTIVVRDATGQPAFHDGVLTDITERKQQQEVLSNTLTQQKKLNKRLEEANNQLMQSEKMASIGQLAAGVAHELNNPIGFVHSNLGTLDGYIHDLLSIIDAFEGQLAAPGDIEAQRDIIRHVMEQHDFAFLKDDIFNLLNESKDGLARVRKIVLDLKNFSRVGEQEWQEADLHQGIDSTLNIVWNDLKYKAKVIKEYGDIPPIFCLISQLNQVFMNLLVNAGHAIEKQGTITIRTRRQGEDQVCLEFIDTGKGIAPENINRIFEPFFTTKPVGQGTGLGLSLSYGIVQRHGGRLEVDSIVGQGTTFRLLLPINPAQKTEPQNPETPS